MNLWSVFTGIYVCLLYTSDAADDGISFVYEVLAKSDPELGIFTLKGEPIVREFNVIYLKHADVREKMEWFL